MEDKRVTIFAGHYGSGKSSIAVSYALLLRRKKTQVAIADMDIVNPYFRSADSRQKLEQSGVEVVVSPYVGGNLDVPALPKELYGITEDRRIFAVLDVGGDDRGAVALGRYAPSILRENQYQMLFVTNFFRPLTRTPEEALSVLREIEQAGGIPFTGLVNNSNLGTATTADDVLSTTEPMERLKELAGLPVVMTTAAENSMRSLTGRIPDLFQIQPLVVMAAAQRG
jgi:energy-coupling factor transporter ATP-binding protein EcfA2